MSSPPPERAAEEPDPDLLARWLAISGLLAASQEMLARRSGAWAAIALATIDAAVEAILGLVATSGISPVDTNAKFERILEQANDALRGTGQEIPPSLRQRLVHAHRARNLALHLGVEPNPKVVDRAMASAIDLREVAITRSSTLVAFRSDGPIRAVANLILGDTENVASNLRTAADALDAHEWTVACDQAAAALDRALRRVAPPLRDRIKRYRKPFGIHEWGSPAEGIEYLDSRADHLEAWVIAIGLGLPPAQLARLRETLGHPRWLGNNDEPTVFRPEGIVVDQRLAESAVLTVTDIVFRLWQSGSLAEDPYGY